ncbi:phosphate-starvation-inducible PsiE family protein [Desulfonauticus submarinus]
MKLFRNNNPQVLFDRALKYIVNVLIIYSIVILTIGLVKTIYSIKFLVQCEQLGREFARVVTDIVNYLVIIELFRTFIEYFKANRIRLHSMMDPFIVFIVRELMVKLYTHNRESVGWETLVGFAVLILSMGIVRTLAVLFSPKQE